MEMMEMLRVGLIVVKNSCNVALRIRMGLRENGDGMQGMRIGMRGEGRGKVED